MRRWTDLVCVRVCVRDFCWYVRCDSLEFEAFDADDFELEDVLSQEIAARGKRERDAMQGDMNDARTPMKRGKKLNNTNNNQTVYVEYSSDGTFKMRNGVKMKGQWTAEEDGKLTELVRRYGTRRWSHISRALYGRVGKQCRERWNNHLAPDIKRGSWSAEEEDILIRVHREVGNRWSDIARHLRGRTENAIKNHWNATKRRKDGTSTPLRDYIMDYTSRQDSYPQDSSPCTTFDSYRAAGASPSHSTINKKEDAMNSNISTQDGFVSSNLRSSHVVQGASAVGTKSISVNSLSVPELHEPIVIKLAGNSHDYVEILNSHEQLTQDRVHHADLPNCEVASYASTVPLPECLMQDAKATLEGLVDAVRGHCPVVSLVLTMKSGSTEILKRFGGNCYMLSVSARKWEEAMQAVRLAVGFIKSSGQTR